jgi:hypothetical protein
MNEKKINPTNLLSFNSNKGQIGVGRTLDNTIYNTKIIKELGGFPKLTIAGIDTVLSFIIKVSGYDWLVDTSVCSLHIRPKVSDALKHQYTYSSAFKQTYCVAEKLTGVPFTEKCHIKTLLKRLVTSPLIGLRLAIRHREPKLVLIYPFYQVYFLNGFIKGTKYQTVKGYKT